MDHNDEKEGGNYDTDNDLESGLWYSDMLHSDILIWIDLVTVVTHASALESSVKLITQNANYCKLQLRDNGNISDLGSIFGPGRQESWKTVLVNCDVIRLSLDRMCVSGQTLDSGSLRKAQSGPMQQVGIAIVQKSPSPIHPARPLARICKWFQAKLHSLFAKWLLRWGNFGRFFRVVMGKMEEGGKTGTNQETSKKCSSQKTWSKDLCLSLQIGSLKHFFSFIAVWNSLLVRHSHMRSSLSTLQFGPAWPLSLHAQGPYHQHSPYQAASASVKWQIPRPSW